LSPVGDQRIELGLSGLPRRLKRRVAVREMPLRPAPLIDLPNETAFPAPAGFEMQAEGVHGLPRQRIFVGAASRGWTLCRSVSMTSISLKLALSLGGTLIIAGQSLHEPDFLHMTRFRLGNQAFQGL